FVSSVNNFYFLYEVTPSDFIQHIQVLSDSTKNCVAAIEMRCGPECDKPLLAFRMQTSRGHSDQTRLIKIPRSYLRPYRIIQTPISISTITSSLYYKVGNNPMYRKVFIFHRISQPDKIHYRTRCVFFPKF